MSLEIRMEFQTFRGALIVKKNCDSAKTLQKYFAATVVVPGTDSQLKKFLDTHCHLISQGLFQLRLIMEMKQKS